MSELKERPAHLQANKEEPADSAAGGNGNAVSAEISVKAQEEGTQGAAAEALAKEDVGTEERIGQYVAGTSSIGAAEPPAGNEEVKAAFADHLEYLDFGIMDDDKNMLLLECARRGLASRVRAALQAGAEAAYTDKVRVHA